jgi:Flp pilus assembly protein TadG
MAIETAIVAPVLVLMAIGSFQISSIVARKSELQHAAAEAAAIALATAPTTQEELDTVRDVLKVSAGLGDGDVTVGFSYRCSNAVSRVTNMDLCATDDTVSGRSSASARIWTWL